MVLFKLIFNCLLWCEDSHEISSVVISHGSIYLVSFQPTSPDKHGLPLAQKIKEHNDTEGQSKEDYSPIIGHCTQEWVYPKLCNVGNPGNPEKRKDQSTD